MQQCLLDYEEIQVQPHPKEIQIDNPKEYDAILLSYSGGKDSLACLLYLLELDIPRDKIQLWHQDIDGGGEPFADWPVTEEYVRVTGEALGSQLPTT